MLVGAVEQRYARQQHVLRCRGLAAFNLLWQCNL